MPRIFSITTPADKIQLDAKGQGQVTFVVTNNAHQSLRCQFKLRVQEGTHVDWLSFEPSGQASASTGATQELEREFAESETHHVVVKVSVPPNTPQPAQHPYTFRVDAISTRNPDEDYTEGPLVAIALPMAEPSKKPFPWWILVVLAAIAAIGGVVGYIIWKSQQSYLEIPNLVGLPVDDATALLTESDESDTDAEVSNSVNVAIEYQTIVICETPDEAVILPNHVLRQTPTAGESVTRNDTVTLIAVAEDSTVAVPNVQGLSISDAQTRLSNCNLQPSLDTEFAPDETPGHVFGQLPAAGNTVAPNSTVTLTIPSETIVMPNVRGFDQTSATEQLEELGFVITDVRIVASEEDVGTVLRQVPAPNTTHSPGLEVELTVAGESVLVPNVVSLPIDEAVNAINSADLRVYIDRSLDPSDLVNHTSPPANTRLLSGQRVTLCGSSARCPFGQIIIPLTEYMQIHPQILNNRQILDQQEQLPIEIQRQRTIVPQASFEIHEGVDSN